MKKITKTQQTEVENISISPDKFETHISLSEEIFIIDDASLFMVYSKTFFPEEVENASIFEDTHENKISPSKTDKPLRFSDVTLQTLFGFK